MSGFKLARACRLGHQSHCRSRKDTGREPRYSSRGGMRVYSRVGRERKLFRRSVVVARKTDRKKINMTNAVKSNFRLNILDLRLEQFYG